MRRKSGNHHEALDVPRRRLSERGAIRSLRVVRTEGIANVEMGKRYFALCCVQCNAILIQFQFQFHQARQRQQQQQQQHCVGVALLALGTRLSRGHTLTGNQPTNQSESQVRVTRMRGRSTAGPVRRTMAGVCRPWRNGRHSTGWRTTKQPYGTGWMVVSVMGKESSLQRMDHDQLLLQVEEQGVRSGP